jgi:hypothetical protein
MQKNNTIIKKVPNQYRLQPELVVGGAHIHPKPDCKFCNESILQLANVMHTFYTLDLREFSSICCLIELTGF